MGLNQTKYMHASFFSTNAYKIGGARSNQLETMPMWWDSISEKYCYFGSILADAYPRQSRF